MRVRRVFGLFWPLFDSKIGGPYTFVDIAPQFWIENRLKRTEQSTGPHFADTLLERVNKLDLKLLVVEVRADLSIESAGPLEILFDR